MKTATTDQMMRERFDFAVGRNKQLAVPAMHQVRRNCELLVPAYNLRMVDEWSTVFKPAASALRLRRLGTGSTGK